MVEQTFLEKYPHQFNFRSTTCVPLKDIKLEMDDDYYIVFARMEYRHQTEITTYEYIVHASSVEAETVFRLKYG